MKSIAFLLCSFITSLSTLTAQQRIGVDISSQMTNLMFTVHYQKVLKNRVLYSFGAFGGGNGRTFVKNDTIRLYSGNSIRSPYATANEVRYDSLGNYSILDYRTQASSIGIQAGLGYFHEFDVQHGLRFNLNTALGFATAHLTGYYRSIENFNEVVAIHTQQHWFGSVSFEAYHTIRLTGRMTFNYGVKVPYFFTLDRTRFNPSTHKDLLYGFEPQLSIGMTRVIGKCD